MRKQFKRQGVLLALAALLIVGEAIIGVHIARWVSPYSYAQQGNLLLRASDILVLSRSEKLAAWKDLHRRFPDQYGPPGFSPISEWVLPPAIAVRPMTRRALRAVPGLAPYEFAMVQGRLLIVNPNNMKVAEVIRGHRRKRRYWDLIGGPN